MSAADAVLFVHSVFVLGVVLPVPLLVIGKLREWKWVRSLPLRVAHVLMIGIVVAESILDIDCPLTLIENRLRLENGEMGYGDSFIAYWLRRVIFWEFPSWVFTAAYATFGALIIFLWWWVRPTKKSV